MKAVTQAAEKTEELTFIEKLASTAVPVKWVSFHAGTGFPGAVADATTYSPAKQPGIELSYHPQSAMVFVRMKGRLFATYASSVKGMEF